ncbi:MAG TPA: hypothetical protein VFJ58_04460 [Armatimonadota bacterium]|nr:hypothetical protein [Armatimonadota bacterium]
MIKHREISVTITQRQTNTVVSSRSGGDIPPGRLLVAVIIVVALTALSSQHPQLARIILHGLARALDVALA